jgi:arylformamidase
MTPEDIERGYNNRAAVPDFGDWFVRWARASDDARARLRGERDVRYGPNPKETLDILLPAGDARGTFVFIHGGYWRALDKAEHAFIAPPLAAAGYAVALLNYDLCPDVGIDTIVDECTRAIAWIGREGRAHGLEPSRLVIGGHSAGGHLAAMMHVTDWSTRGMPQPAIAGAVSLSGVHDLVPLLQFSFNSDFKLREADALRLSPIHYEPTTTAPILVAAGADETSEFLRQSRLLWDAWPKHRPRAARDFLAVPDRHHFSVVMDYADPGTELTRQTLALFR